MKRYHCRYADVFPADYGAYYSAGEVDAALRKAEQERDHLREAYEAQSADYQIQFAALRKAEQERDEAEQERDEAEQSAALRGAAAKIAMDQRDTERAAREEAEKLAVWAARKGVMVGHDECVRPCVWFSVHRGVEYDGSDAGILAALRRAMKETK